MFGCWHKYTEVKDGYQYCNKCGLAKSAPDAACCHKWEKIAEYTETVILTQAVLAYIYVMQCKKCGDIKKEEI